jgi:hypothetical protein
VWSGRSWGRETFGIGSLLERLEARENSAHVSIRIRPATIVPAGSNPFAARHASSVGSSLVAHAPF